uniref:Uncharacterized protein n=1 Tax=Cacopsylla melanoneura TaxID=428564 RepID=A0A8D9BBK7_9HEMI
MERVPLVIVALVMKFYLTCLTVLLLVGMSKLTCLIQIIVLQVALTKMKVILVMHPKCLQMVLYLLKPKINLMKQWKWNKHVQVNIQIRVGTKQISVVVLVMLNVIESQRMDIVPDTTMMPILAVRRKRNCIQTEQTIETAVDKMESHPNPKRRIPMRKSCPIQPMQNCKQ